MLRQATLGDVDFITGDYLAGQQCLMLFAQPPTFLTHSISRKEVNLAENAEAMAAGKHEGFEPTAWDGLQQTIGVLSSKRIKVIINGGALNPMGLAKKCYDLVSYMASLGTNLRARNVYESRTDCRKRL